MSIFKTRRFKGSNQLFSSTFAWSCMKSFCCISDHFGVMGWWGVIMPIMPYDTLRACVLSKGETWNLIHTGHFLIRGTLTFSPRFALCSYSIMIVGYCTFNEAAVFRSFILKKNNGISLVITRHYSMFCYFAISVIWLPPLPYLFVR